MNYFCWKSEFIVSLILLRVEQCSYCSYSDVCPIWSNGGPVLLRGYLHAWSELTFNPDQTHSTSVETIEDSIIFVYMNREWVTTSSFCFFIPHRNADLEWNVDPKSCKPGARFHAFWNERCERENYKTELRMRVFPRVRHL